MIEAPVKPQPKRVIVFPGQGVSGPDMTSYFQLLRNADPQITDGYLGIAQDSLDRLSDRRKDKPVSFKEILTDPTSISFSRTRIVQPLTYALDMIAFEIAKKQGHTPESLNVVAMAGHSLGEIAALTAAGVIRYKRGTEIVAFRANVMQKACDKPKSKLLSLPGLTKEQTTGICMLFGLEVALINAHDRIVVGGEKDRIEWLVRTAKKLNKLKTADISTNGAFHHPRLMLEAAAAFAEFVLEDAYLDSRYPIITNIDAKPTTNGSQLQEKNNAGINNPVNWAGSVDEMRGLANEALQAGPGNSLVQLNKRGGLNTRNISTLLAA